MIDNLPILLVEDDVVDVKTVKRAFKENKILNMLKVVGNGEEALAYLRHKGEYADKEANPRPGIILLDLNMPVMNGIEFLRAARPLGVLRGIPVVVLTTSKMENDRMESYDLGVAGYIIKPVEFDKFVEAVRTLDLYWTLCQLPHPEK